MDLKSNRPVHINSVNECINVIHSIFDFYVANIPRSNTGSLLNTTGNANRNDTSLEFNRQLPSKIHSLENLVDELTKTNYVIKNKLDTNKVKPEKTKTDYLKNEKINKGKMELRLNYLSHIKEYYTYYLNYYVSVYSNYYIDNNEVNKKLFDIFGFLKRFSLIHVKLILGTLPRLNNPQFYFESFNSLETITIPSPRNNTASTHSKNSNTGSLLNSAGNTKNNLNTSSNTFSAAVKDFLHNKMGNKYDFNYNLIEEFVSYLSNNGFVHHGSRLIHLLPPKEIHENPKDVGEPYQQRLQQKPLQYLIPPNNYNLNKMNEKMEI